MLGNPFIARFLTELSTQTAVFLPKLGGAVAIFALFWVSSRVAQRFLMRACDRGNPNAKDLIMLVEKVVTLTLITFGVVTALGTLGINASALVAGLGLTGFAVGFAFKDALSNLLAGAMILFYHPFHRGDYISITGLEGTVAEVNLRYTVLVTDDRRFLVPNSLLLTNSITLVKRTSSSPATIPVAKA